MNTDRASLFQAVKAAPDDDTVRLVYADAVQESGDEELASLIRVGVLCWCERSAHPWKMHGVDRCYTCGDKGWVRRCQEDECRRDALTCVVEGHVNGERDDIEEYYCGEHAPLHGYCSACGAFCTGIDSFEALGICDPCRDELREYDEEDDDWADVEYGADEDFEP